MLASWYLGFGIHCSGKLCLSKSHWGLTCYSDGFSFTCDILCFFSLGCVLYTYCFNQVITWYFVFKSCLFCVLPATYIYMGVSFPQFGNFFFYVLVKDLVYVIALGFFSFIYVYNLKTWPFHSFPYVLFLC